MKILTAAQMREVDRLTIQRGIPGIVLMENAGSRVVDFLLETFHPLSSHDVLVICGKGNNGGDGFVVARQLFTRCLCRRLTILELFDPATLTGDALLSRNALGACGCPVLQSLPPELPPATVVVDAILGTGLQGPAEGLSLKSIQWVNTSFPLAKKVAVDIPSGLPSDQTHTTGEFIRTDFTVTFTAAKPSQVLSPIYEHMGRLRIYVLGSPPDLLTVSSLNLTTEEDLRSLFAPRVFDSNKGLYGHVLVLGGSYGKSGAPAMASLAAYRTGAGLVTVAVPESVLPTVAGFRPELMTVTLEDTEAILEQTTKMTVLAVGPGLGLERGVVRFVKSLYADSDTPAVFDADGLNAIAGDIPHCGSKLRILTPHPVEMCSISGMSTKDVQSDRLGVAQQFAGATGAVVVLKGDRTVIAFPDGETWINPTGSPAMATGGTGDILTGMVAGLLAQHPPASHPDNWRRALIAAVWLHGRCGQLAAERLGEQCTLATDLLDALPEAMNELRPV